MRRENKVLASLEQSDINVGSSVTFTIEEVDNEAYLAIENSVIDGPTTQSIKLYVGKDCIDKFLSMIKGFNIKGVLDTKIKYFNPNAPKNISIYLYTQYDEQQGYIVDDTVMPVVIDKENHINKYLPTQGCPNIFQIFSTYPEKILRGHNEVKVKDWDKVIQRVEYAINNIRQSINQRSNLQEIEGFYSILDKLLSLLRIGKEKEDQGYSCNLFFMLSE